MVIIDGVYINDFVDTPKGIYFLHEKKDYSWGPTLITITWLLLGPNQK
jgi:hypothetical protein